MKDGYYLSTQYRSELFKVENNRYYVVSSLRDCLLHVGWFSEKDKNSLIAFSLDKAINTKLMDFNNKSIKEHLRAACMGTLQ